MRRHHCVAITALSTVTAVHEVVHEPLLRLADDRLAHAGVDPLAFAGAITMAQRSKRMKNDAAGDRIVRPGPARLARRAAGTDLRVEHPHRGHRHRAPYSP